MEAQLAAIDEARAELTDEEAGQLNITRYAAAVSALAALDRQTGADVPVPAAEQEAEYRYCDSNGQNWQTGKVTATVVTADNATNGWGVADNQAHWYVVNSDVTFTQRITVTGNVHLILANGYTLDATNGGIQVADDDSDIQSAGEP